MCEMSDRTAGVRTLAVLVCAAFIPLFGACGSESEAPDSPTAVVDSVGGVPRFTYPEDPATVIAWELDTIAVIGGYEQEDGAYQFDEVGPGGVAGDARNALFVLDVPWLPTHKTLGDVLDRIVAARGEEAAGIIRRAEQADDLRAAGAEPVGEQAGRDLTARLTVDQMVEGVGPIAGVEVAREEDDVPLAVGHRHP